MVEDYLPLQPSGFLMSHVDLFQSSEPRGHHGGAAKFSIRDRTLDWIWIMCQRPGYPRLKQDDMDCVCDSGSNGFVGVGEHRLII